MKMAILLKCHMSNLPLLLLVGIQVIMVAVLVIAVALAEEALAEAALVAEALAEAEEALDLV